MLEVAILWMIDKVCIPNKTEDLNLSVFNIITFIYESRTLTKHLSCERKSKFDVPKRKSNQWWNKDNCWCECKKHHICEKGNVWNLATCNYENGKYLASIMDNLVITCDEVIKSYDKEMKTTPTNFNEKNVTCKTQGFHILLTFLSITFLLIPLHYW